MEAGDCGEENGKKKRSYGAETCRLLNEVAKISGCLPMHSELMVAN